MSNCKTKKTEDGHPEREALEGRLNKKDEKVEEKT
jgi:hypothetical protein